MKNNFLPAFAFVLFLTACSKTVSVQEGQDVFSTKRYFYESNFLLVNNFSVKNVNGFNVINFSTLHEKGLSSLEILSGENENYLCAIQTYTLNGNNVALKQYEFVDKLAKSSTTYYALRYKVGNEQWRYTTTFKFNVNN